MQVRVHAIVDRTARRAAATVVAGRAVGGGAQHMATGRVVGGGVLGVGARRIVGGGGGGRGGVGVARAAAARTGLVVAEGHLAHETLGVRVVVVGGGSGARAVLGDVVGRCGGGVW